MLHDNLCKITNRGAVAVFAIGAVITLIMYLSATFYMTMSEASVEATSKTSLFYERTFSKASLLIMFACAAVGGLIMVYALSWYMKKTNGPQLFVVGIQPAQDEIVIEHAADNPSVTESQIMPAPQPAPKPQAMPQPMPQAMPQSMHPQPTYTSHAQFAPNRLVPEFPEENGRAPPPPAAWSGKASLLTVPITSAESHY
jgi:hypothetical protein